MIKNLNRLRSIFRMNKVERNATVFLALMLLVFVIFPRWKAYYRVSGSKPAITENLHYQALIREKDSQRDSTYERKFKPKKKAPLFSLRMFDPNAVSEAELLQMKLPERLSKNWSKYLQAGGRFKKSEDVMKIHGMKKEWFQQIEPYLQLEENKEAENPIETKFKKADTPLDINHADSTELLHIRGIGPAFARRIIQYRHSLGGFVALEQLQEVYGMTREKYEEIEPQLEIRTAIKPIYINRFDRQQLGKHPYIRKKAAIIVAYREQHGPYQSVEDLKKILILEDSLITKIVPYLNFE